MAVANEFYDRVCDHVMRASVLMFICQGPYVQADLKLMHSTVFAMQPSSTTKPTSVAMRWI